MNRKIERMIVKLSNEFTLKYQILKNELIERVFTYRKLKKKE